MSIISTYKTDKSDILYKRFASLAATYLDEPEAAKTSTAQIPLENLYRLFEMFRYDAFADQNRSGILAINAINNISSNSVQEEWHIKIKRALSKAIDVAYSSHRKDKAIDEIESVLKGLANEGSENDDPNSQEQAKVFFNRFIEELDK